jgi:hypothetical protein
MDEMNQLVKVDRDTLISRDIASLLKEQKRLVRLERLQLLARHGVRGREALERAIQEGSVEEYPTWEEVMVLEHLDAEIASIDGYRNTYRKTMDFSITRAVTVGFSMTRAVTVLNYPLLPELSNLAG